ncbi:hypothetical protein PIROE2DRAFT_2610 [Piromyces sp. E2]|nr:hypothetical protein PIROE2DRAFT_2610 [Piromyces sp. E2]|eukprot:OUM69514.1 hypothetical protein PIROE2DRAFT_2610 [Piromyces sp. E2]
MLFNQLKTLLWRNAILKRRGLVSTLLEIIIPTLIILLLGLNSNGGGNSKKKLQGIVNSPIVSIENDTLLWDNNEYKQISLGIIFSQDFNDQMKNTFVENIKTNKLFSNFTLLPKEQQFSTKQDKTLNNETNVPINDLIKKEYKIFVSTSELELKDAYKESFNDKNEKEKYKFYGIMFKSLTKYEIYFRYNDDDEYDELIDKSKDENTKEKTLLIISLVKTLTNIPEYTVNTKIMDRGSYEYNNNNKALSVMTPLFMLFYFVPCVSSLLNHLVIEKESRIKESLVIIGLKKSSFWISWAITYGLIITISSVLVTIAMYFFKLFVYINWSATFVVTIVYGLSCCCISFILSTLIKKSKTASTLGVMKQ